MQLTWRRIGLSGTKGQLHVDPAYEYAEGLVYELTVNGKTTRKRIGKRDQFAPELLYFSDCILKNREPEPRQRITKPGVRKPELVNVQSASED